MAHSLASGSCVQDVHHDAVDSKEDDGLRGIRYGPVRNRDDCTDARKPEHGPSQLVFVAWIFPSRHERWDGADEQHAEADDDPEKWATEDQPQRNPENSTTETKFVEFCPAGRAVFQSKCSDYPCSCCCTNDLAICGVLEAHSDEGDGVQARPNDPRRFHRPCLAIDDGNDVGDKSTDKQQSRHEIHGCLHWTPPLS